MTPETNHPGAGPNKPADDAARASDQVKREVHSAKAEAQHAASDIRAGAHDLADQAREKARQGAEHGKDNVAAGLDDFAAAVRKASDELGSRDQSMASQIIREVAGGLEHASQTIHGKDVGELTRSVSRFARERPATFLVGAALAGLALGRFARSSSEHSEADYHSGQPRHPQPGGASSSRDAFAGGGTTAGASSPSPTPTAAGRPSHATPTYATPIGSQNPGGTRDQ